MRSSKCHRLLLLSLLAYSGSAVSAQAPAANDLRDLPTIGRINATSGQVIEGLHVVNPLGPCIVVPADVRNVVIRNNNIGPCGDKSQAVRDYGVFILDRASNITVQQNVIHDVSSGVGAFRAAHPITIDRNRVYNIRGPKWAGQVVQFNGVRGGRGRSAITCNIYDGRAEKTVGSANYVNDHISIYSSSGTESDPIEIAYNRIRGSIKGTDESGSGMQLGDSEAGGGATGEFDGGGWIWAHDNTIVQVNGVGISVAGGSNIMVERNRIENQGDNLASLTGWAFSAVAFSPGTNVTFRDNLGSARLWAFNRDGTPGNGIFQDRNRRFTTLIEERNRYGPEARLTPSIFNEIYPECN